MEDVKIEIIKVTLPEKQILANLLELYLHDFSEFTHTAISADGKYGYKYLDKYWTDSNRHPFLIKVDDEIAGFVLVNLNDPEADAENIHAISEFFIMRKFRHQGIGTQVAIKVFDMFLGKWEILALDNNKVAQDFWEKVIHEYTKGDYENRQRDKGPILSFSNK